MLFFFEICLSLLKFLSSNLKPDLMPKLSKNSTTGIILAIAIVLIMIDPHSLYQSSEKSVNYPQVIEERIGTLDSEKFA